MAFNPNPGRNEYTATAGQTLFTFNFKIYATSDIKVYLTPVGQNPDDVIDILTETTDYTVVINGDSGGTVTLVVAATAGDMITFKRDLATNRDIEYQRLGDMSAATLNLDQDYQTYLIADQESNLTRFIRIPDSAQGVDLTLPSPVPLNFFQWNSTGDAIINVDSLQADGFVWTAADLYTAAELDAGQLDTRYYTETEIDDKSKLWDAQTTTHDFASDADYTLTAAQNLYGRIILTDTGVVLTTARNVITDNKEKNFIVQNDTAQTITVKTLAGTGISITAGNFANLYNDGTNIISSEQTRGLIIQEDAVYTGTAASGTGTIPIDNTIPQITEGTQFMSLVFTPKDANSKLIIEACFVGANSVDNNITIALFDGNSDAIGATSLSPRATALYTNTVTAELLPGSTAPITFTLRAGGNAAGTTYFNQTSASVSVFNGKASSYIRVMEVAQ